MPDSFLCLPPNGAGCSLRQQDLAGLLSLPHWNSAIPSATHGKETAPSSSFPKQCRPSIPILSFSAWIVVEMLDMAAGSCNPLGCLGAPQDSDPCPNHALRPGFEGSEGIQELNFSTLSKATKRGLFPLVEKPQEIAAVEKQSYCQTRKCLPICLLIFGAPFWMVFKPKPKHPRQQLPALLPPSLGSCTRGSSRDGKRW